MTSSPNRENRSKNAGVLILCLGGFLVLCCYILPAFTALIVSFQPYDLGDKVFGGHWTGFLNYQRILTNQSFGRVLRNTLVMGVLGGILPLLPGMLIGRAAAKCPPKTSWVFTGMLLLPAFLPADYLGRLVRFLFRTQVLNAMDGYAAWLWYGLLAGVRTCAFTAFLSAYLGRIAVRHGRSPEEGAKLGGAVQLAFGLMTVLTLNREFCRTVYTTPNYEVADSFATVFFAVGGDSDGGVSSALWVLRTLMSLPGLAAGTALLLWVYRQLLQWREKPEERPEEREPTAAALPWGIAGAVLTLGALAALPIRFPVQTTEMPAGVLQSSVVILLESTLVNLLLLLAGGWLMGRFRGGVFLCLLLPLAENTYGQYIFLRAQGLYNARLAPSLLAGNLAVVAALGLLTASLGQSYPSFRAWRRNALPLLALFGGWAAIESWGGVGRQVDFFKDRSNYGISLIWREIAMNTSMREFALTTSSPIEIGSLKMALWQVVPMAVVAALAVLIFGRLMDRRQG